ncbi:MAG TPA: FeoA family protein [Candidatus Hydrogenedens sp.]|nr:FeoA family protein [Candidatus Hydrogenedens sp.]HOL20918.1 FeoA family protein [Candidatus Hydrogenedens sp.]HPP57639.1 FeoA family protein [Candidatus Hydrogenedens sp.]
MEPSSNNPCKHKLQGYTPRLSDLKEGQLAKVIGIRGGPPTYRKRLLDLGLTPGTEVKVSREAPLGDPIEIELKGYFLALRRKDAWHILVEPLQNNHE